MPAQCPGPLQKHHVMAHQAAHPGSLQSGAAAAQYNDPFRLEGFPDAIFPLPSRRGIQLAAHGVDPEEAGLTPLVCPAAGPDIIDPPLGRLVGKLGIADLLPADGYQIRLSRLQGRLRPFKVQGAHGDHRDAHRLLHLGRQGKQLSRRLIDRLTNPLPLGLIGAGGAMDIIQQSLQLLHKATGLLRLQTLRPQKFVHADPKSHDKVPAHRLTDGFNGLPRHPETVFKAAAIFIRPPVSSRRYKFPQQVTVGPMDLHPIKPGPLGPVRCQGKIPLNAPDLLPCQLPRLTLDEGAWNGTGRHTFQPGGRRRRLPAAVAELDHSQTAVILNGLGQHGLPGHQVVGIEPRGGAGGTGLQSVHIGIFHNDHTASALCPGLIVIDQFGHGVPGNGAHPRLHGWQDNAVTHDLVSNGKRAVDQVLPLQASSPFLDKFHLAGDRISKGPVANNATGPNFVILSVSEGSFLPVCPSQKDSSPLWGSE